MRHLQNDGPIEMFVVGQIGKTKAPAAQDLFDAVTADALRWLALRGNRWSNGARVLAWNQTIWIAVFHVASISPKRVY